MEEGETEQCKAASLITGCYRSSHTDNLLKEAKLTPVYERGKILAGNEREKHRDATNPNQDRP